MGFQCFQHIHECPLPPFSGPIAMWVIGTCLCLGDACTLTHLLDYCAFNVASLVSMQFCGEPKAAEEILPQDHSHRGGFLVFGGIGLRMAGKVVTTSIFSRPPLDISRVKMSTQTSSMGQLLWMLTRGTLWPAVGVFLRQHLPHCSHHAFTSWNIFGQ